MNKGKQPQIKISINSKSFIGLIDTGSDITIITEKDWPLSWPVQQLPCEIKGIGSQPLISIKQSV
jgi:hypothetical protein